MNKFLRLIFAVAFFIANSFVGTAFAGGVLLEFSGEVLVLAPDGARLSPKPGLSLSDGSSVEVSKGASAVLLLDSGALDKIESGSYKVGEERKENRKTLGSSVVVAMNELYAGGSKPVVQGMVKGVHKRPKKGNFNEPEKLNQRALSAKEKTALSEKLGEINSLGLSANAASLLSAQAYINFGQYESARELLTPLIGTPSSEYASRLLSIARAKN